MTTQQPQTLALGLIGIQVAETKLSCVDGSHGRLVVAGQDIEPLAERASFAELCASLWSLSGFELDDDAQDVERQLAAARIRAFDGLSRLGNALHLKDPMDALRAALAQLPDSSTPYDILGATAVFAAAHQRVRTGQPAKAPSEARHARDLLRMLDLEDSDAQTAALEAYLVTAADHGLNASTFAARVIASTRSDLVSAVVGAVGALKGPLHGGAPGPVLTMLDEIGRAEHARAWLERALDAGERIMGMGHRVYRTRDPRAAALEVATRKLEASFASDHRSRDTRARLNLAHAVEREAERLLAQRYPGRALRANVEFYTAVLLDALGITRDAFSSIFAASRALGWTAHIQEQWRSDRLIRPSSRYVGPLPAR